MNLTDSNDIPNDNRVLPLSRTALKKHNESTVYKALKNSDTPLTASEISSTISGISEKTVRRALNALRTNGFVVQAGKSSTGSMMFQTADALPSWGTGDGRRIPLGTAFVSVKDFVEVMASTNHDPFASNTKKEILTDEIRNFLRVRMLFAVLTSGEPGHDAQLSQVRNSLITAANELDRLTKMVDKFTNSAVWYPQYRDGIAYDVRQMQKDKPELFQLAWDFMTSSSGKD